MHRDKRRWIYAGLAVPPGVAVAARSMPHFGADRLLLLGGDAAAGLGPPLGRLARDAGLSLRVDSRRGSTPADWRKRGWARPLVAAAEPSLVLVALEQGPDAALLDAELRAAAAVNTIWLSAERKSMWDRTVQPPPHMSRTVHTGACGGTMVHTAAGYAAWAASVWQALRL